MHVFYKVFFIVSLLTVQATLIAYGQQELSPSVRLNRKKRFLIFPKGTVIQLVYCYLMSALGTEGIFTVGVTLGTNWDVPGDLDKLMYNDNMKIKANRRERRSLYPKIEYMLNQLSIDGKSCIRRLLCQSHNRSISTTNFQPKNSFVEEIIRAVFSYPTLPEGIVEPIDEYDYMLDQCAKTNFDDACIKR